MRTFGLILATSLACLSLAGPAVSKPAAQARPAAPVVKPLDLQLDRYAPGTNYFNRPPPLSELVSERRGAEVARGERVGLRVPSDGFWEIVSAGSIRPPLLVKAPGRGELTVTLGSMNGQGRLTVENRLGQPVRIAPIAIRRTDAGAMTSSDEGCVLLNRMRITEPIDLSVVAVILPAQAKVEGDVCQRTWRPFLKEGDVLVEQVGRFAN